MQPLINDRSVYLLQEGLGFLCSYTLEQHRNYFPSKYRRTYKPFALYDENQYNPVANSFIKNGGVYFPKDEFDTYVSLLGGSISDVSFVLENFNNKRLILNETENSLYGVLLSLRDFPEETISLYRNIVRKGLKVSTSKDASIYYHKVKTSLYENLGTGKLHEIASLLLYLLHVGSIDSGLSGLDVSDYFNHRILSLVKWHNVLSSDRVSLYHTNDYQSIPLPTTGRNLIVANTPEYSVGDSSCWSASQVREFCSFFVELGLSTDSFLLASSNTSPMYRSHFTKTRGWSTYNVVTDETYPVLYYTDSYHKNNINRCLCTNYQLKLPVSNLTPFDSNHTNELINLYQIYCSSLL